MEALLYNTLYPIRPKAKKAISIIYNVKDIYPSTVFDSIRVSEIKIIIESIVNISLKLVNRLLF